MGEEVMSTCTHIETGIDKLKVLVDDAKRISVTNAAKQLNVSKDVVRYWTDVLEDTNQLDTDSNFVEVFLVSKSY